MKKIKVLYIHHGGIHGGSPLSLLQLLNGLGDRVEPIICSALNDLNVVSFFQNHGYRAVRINLPMFDHTTLASYSLFSISDLMRLFRWVKNYNSACADLHDLILEINPDLVHYNSITLAPYSVVSKKLKIPSIVHVREPLLRGYFGLRKKVIEYYLQKCASQVISICEDNLFRINLKNKGVVVYNPVDFNKFDFHISMDEQRDMFDLPRDRVVISYLGGVHFVKGPHLFLKSMKKLLEKSGDSIHLFLPSFRRFSHPGRNLIRKVVYAFLHPWITLNIFTSNKIFDQFIRDGVITVIDFSFSIEKCIAASNIICVAHAKPHFARVVMEAGAMKKPVVAFNVGGVSEVVVNTKTGFLVSKANFNEMAARVYDLVNDQELRRTMGDEGYAQAVSKFDSKISSNSVFDVYLNILN